MYLFAFSDPTCPVDGDIVILEETGLKIATSHCGSVQIHPYEQVIIRLLERLDDEFIICVLEHGDGPGGGRI